MIFSLCDLWLCGEFSVNQACKSVCCKDKLLVMSDFSRKKNMQSNNLRFIPLILIIWSFRPLNFTSKSVFCFFFTYSEVAPVLVLHMYG